MAQNSEGERLEERESSEDRYVRVPLAVSTPVKHAISLSLPSAQTPVSVSSKTSASVASNQPDSSTTNQNSSSYLKSVGGTDEPSSIINQENKTNILKSSLTESAEEAVEDSGNGSDLFRVSFRNTGEDDVINFEASERKSPKKETSGTAEIKANAAGKKGDKKSDKKSERRGFSETLDRQRRNGGKAGSNGGQAGFSGGANARSTGEQARPRSLGSIGSNGGQAGSTGEQARPKSMGSIGSNGPNVGGQAGSNESIARNLNEAFAASHYQQPSQHGVVERRSSVNGAYAGGVDRSATSSEVTKPRKIHRTRSLEKPRESPPTEDIRERSYSLNEPQNLSKAISSPGGKNSNKNRSQGGQITEEDETFYHVYPEGALSEVVGILGTPALELPIIPGELTASSRSVNEIEYSNAGPGVHRLHGSSPDLGSMYTGIAGIAGLPSPRRDVDLTGAGQPNKDLDTNGDSPKELSGSHLGSDLSASYGKSGNFSENDSRGGSETGRDPNSRIAKKKRTNNWYNHGKHQPNPPDSRSPLAAYMLHGKHQPNPPDSRSPLAAYMLALSPTYKSRSVDFRKLFKDIPTDERLIVDYSCALQKDILVHGRLYLTQNWVCFYANIFRWETILTIKCKDINSMTKEKTARVIPNAIKIVTRDDNYCFTSFGTRDKTYMMLFRVWQNALMEQPMSSQELWQWVHQMYGDELGLTSSDDDYVPPEELIPLDNSTNSQDIRDGEEDSALNGDSITPPSISSLDKHSSNTNVSLIPSSPEVSLTTNSNLPTPLSVNEFSKGVAPEATSNDIPTDAGDTTEDSDALQSEIICGDHDHEGFLALDEIFQFSPDQIFDLLFSESEFYTEFIQSRKTFDLVMVPWPEENEPDGSKSRVITYTLSLNYSFGPKVSPSTEKQTILPETKLGEIYIVDTEVVNGGVPYGENFYVINRFCITRVSAQRTRLRVHCSIKYRSKIWGLAKTFIEKNAKEGLLENYHLMAECLRREQEKQAYAIGQPPATRKKVLRRRRPHTITQGDISPTVRRRTDSLRQHSQPGTPTRGPRRTEKLTVSQDTLIKVVCAVLILLMAVNMMLYYKLWALEGIALSAKAKYSQRDFIPPMKTPLSTNDWSQLLEQQQNLHEEEIRRWKEILSASVQLVDHMKSTLSELHESLERRSTLKDNG